MFPCGHSLCTKCTDVITNRKSIDESMLHNSRVSCPFCRQICSVSAVKDVRHGAYQLEIAERQRDKEEEEDVEVEVVNTNCTSKILVIVRTLLKIKRREPTAKALVFSCVSNCSILYSHRTAANLYIRY